MNTPTTDMNTRIQEAATATQAGAQLHSASSLETAISSTLSDKNPALAPDAATRAIHKVGSFQEYDTALALADVSGFRAVKCLYKTNAGTGKIAGKNSYIYLVDDVTEENVQARLPEFMPYIVSYLQEQENQIVKELHKSGSVYLADSATGLDVILSKLEASGTGNRLNKEKIESWFIDSMQDSLSEAFSSKMGISAESSEAELAKLISVVDTYKAKFSGLASGKVSYRAEEAEVLVRSLAVTKADKSLIGSRFALRLQRMIDKKDDDLLLAL